jgi:RNA polymerase sigma factor (sigma-70 family)
MNQHLNEPAITDWWLSFRNGNTEAFTDIYEWFYPKLYAYGRKFIMDNEQIRDIIQDLFIKLYTKPNLVVNADTFSTYLFTSFRNACINQAQHSLLHVNIKTVSDFELPFEVAEDIIETQEEEQQIYRQVEIILNNLTPRQREVIYLRFIQELNYEEISRIMNLSGQAARNLIHRAIESVRKKYKKDDSHFILEATGL